MTFFGHPIGQSVAVILRSGISVHGRIDTVGPEAASLSSAEVFLPDGTQLHGKATVTVLSTGVDAIAVKP